MKDLNVGWAQDRDRCALQKAIKTWDRAILVLWVLFFTILAAGAVGIILIINYYANL